MRVFYWLAFPTKRSDLELVLWSLVWSVVLWWAAALVIPPPVDENASNLGTIALAATLGLAGGAVAALSWNRAAKRWDGVRRQVSSTAWDSVMMPVKDGAFYQVHLTDGSTVLGWLFTAAYSAAADDPDLYLAGASFVIDGEEVALDDVDGVLIPRSSIAMVVRFSPLATTEAR
jgi:hypothetical protein